MNETVLVTGSSRGIGMAIALYLARKGYDVVVHCRSRHSEAEQVAQEIEAIGRAARILQFDLADRKQCSAAIEQDIDEHGAYYCVVCNAGVTSDNAFSALTGEERDGVVHTNLDGFYNVLNPAIMPMIRRRKPGRIIPTSPKVMLRRPYWATRFRSAR